MNCSIILTLIDRWTSSDISSHAKTTNMQYMLIHSTWHSHIYAYSYQSWSPKLCKKEIYTVLCTPNMNRHASMISGMCAWAQAGGLMLIWFHPGHTQLHPWWTSRYDRWGLGAPNAGLINHNIADNIWCSPNAIECDIHQVFMVLNVFFWKLWQNV